MRWFICFYLLGIVTHCFTQTTDPNTLPDLDEYTVLRNMVSKTFDDRGNSFTYEYKLHNKEIDIIEYFVDGRSFRSKSNLDIYNRILYADFNRDGIILPYQFESRIDSLNLYLADDELPFAKYIYSPKLDLFAIVLNNQNFIIVEAYNFKLQNGTINPVLDSGNFKDKVILKKIPYLIDTGHWYKIPKNKNDFIKFARNHFKRNIDKSKLKGTSTLAYSIKLNQN